MATLLDGKKVAAEIQDELKVEVEQLKKRGIQPGLALLIVGDNPASKIYVRSKAKACAKIGIYSIVEHKPAESEEREVLNIIEKWNADKAIHGILVQLPLPPHIREQNVLLAIDPRKDVDGFHPENMGRLVEGLPGFVPCTPAGIVELLRRYHIDIPGKNVVIIGRSNIVGKPLALLLSQRSPWGDATVTLCHSKTKNLREHTVKADIVVAAVGKPCFLDAEDIRDGAVVVDVGINRVSDPHSEKGYRIVGDVNFDALLPKVAAITPVPGGVGPMTIAMLLHNTVRAAKGDVFESVEIDIK